MKNFIAHFLLVVIGCYPGFGYSNEESKECLEAEGRAEQLVEEELTLQGCTFLIDFYKDPVEYGCSAETYELIKPAYEFTLRATEVACSLSFGDQLFPIQSLGGDSNSPDTGNHNAEPAQNAGSHVNAAPSTTPTAVSAEQTVSENQNCEGFASGDYLPTVPQPIDAYLGIFSTGYSVYSAGIAATNLVESHQQAVQTGDSYELFDNVYTMLWSAVVPLGDAIGMREIFADFSQFTDDLAAAAANC